MRRGREDCIELDALARQEPYQVMTSVLGWDIQRHARDCQVCQDNMARYAPPAEVFSSLMPVALPMDFKHETLSSLMRLDAAAVPADTLGGRIRDLDIPRQIMEAPRWALGLIATLDNVVMVRWDPALDREPARDAKEERQGNRAFIDEFPGNLEESEPAQVA
jgi:hypothetical protein